MCALSKPIGAILVLLAVCLFGQPAYAKYSGGTGEPNDPYQIATAADLIALGETPADYDKHFILTADIDLDPNLPGRKVFDRAVIAPDTNDVESGYQGNSFSGVFDGNGHKISHLTVEGENDLGLLGELSGKIVNLSVVDVNVTGANRVGGLVGSNAWGAITQCRCTGTVNGNTSIGGLVGYNSGGSITTSDSTGSITGGGSVGGLVGESLGTVTECYSTGIVNGFDGVGGLVGTNPGWVTNCCSTSSVCGDGSVGGLIGANFKIVLTSVVVGGRVAQCYSTGIVNGTGDVGGLIGTNPGEVINCYSMSTVSGDSSVGGLVGANFGGDWHDLHITHGLVTQCYSTGVVNGSGKNVGGLIGSNTEYNYGYEETVCACFWDTEASSQATSDGGTGKTTAEMQTAKTFLEAGWDLVGEISNGTHEIWQMPEESGYPALAAFSGYTPPKLQGMGTLEDPYLISDALELGAMIHYSPYAHYRLAASIDLSGIRWSTSVIPKFAGIFDGDNHTISNLTINGHGYLGLFGQLTSSAQVRDLGLVDVNITGRDIVVGVGGLAGYNGGSITRSSCSGTVNTIGDQWWYLSEGVGGLVGINRYGNVTDSNSMSTVTGSGDYIGGLVGNNKNGNISRCYSIGSVSGNSEIGGLVGYNDQGTITQCYSTGAVSGVGRYSAGGLVGHNYNYHNGNVSQCYSTGSVSGNSYVGGLVGTNQGHVNTSYSTGAVSGTKNVGGLVGNNVGSSIASSFWDTQTSCQARSDGGTGKTTAQMQTAKTFLDAGWDFVGETANGTEDIWWILEGKDYPRLWWER